MAGSFRDLKVWQRSIDLSVATYSLTRDFPSEELYGLTSQLRRAAVSIASNIAERYGRVTTGEYRQFLGIARGSTLELQTQLVIAERLGLGKQELIREVEGLSHEVGKMLWSLAKKL